MTSVSATSATPSTYSPESLFPGLQAGSPSFGSTSTFSSLDAATFPPCSSSYSPVSRIDSDDTSSAVAATATATTTTTNTTAIANDGSGDAGDAVVVVPSDGPSTERLAVMTSQLESARMWAAKIEEEEKRISGVSKEEPLLKRVFRGFLLPLPSENVCSICQDLLWHPTKETIWLSCGHLFHKRCIEDMILEANIQDCPLCAKSAPLAPGLIQRTLSKDAERKRQAKLQAEKQQLKEERAREQQAIREQSILERARRKMDRKSAQQRRSSSLSNLQAMLPRSLSKLFTRKAAKGAGGSGNSVSKFTR